MLIEGGYLHSLKALLDKARKTPEPAPAPEADDKKKSSVNWSTRSHGMVSAETVRHLATKQ
jgi:hypothetical protein